MKKIANWTIGSFFKTIGRILALIFLGYIMSILLSKFDIKLPFMSISKVNALTLSDNTELPDIPEGINYYVIEMEGDTYYLSGWKNQYYYLGKYGESYSSSLFNVYRFQEMNTSNFSNNTNYIYYNDIYYNFSNEFILQPNNQNGDNYRYILQNNQWILGNARYQGYIEDFRVDKIILSNIDIYIATENHENDFILEQGIGLPTFTLNIHLNGGYLTSPLLNNIKYTNDFTITLHGEEQVKNLARNIKPEKVGTVFDGWYLNSNFSTNILNQALGNQSITLNIYAKYIFNEHESIINNITFNDYSFENNNNRYAIISIGSNYNQEIYLALDYNFQDVDVYKYSTENYNELGSFLTLQSILYKDNKYFYMLNTNLVNNQNEYLVIGLDKLKMSITAHDETTNYYNFKVSNNATVTFTNDLTNTVIKNRQGQDITINIEDSWNHTQELMIKEESDFVSIFENLTKDMNNGIFDKFSQVWSKLTGTKIHNYIMLILIGSIITLLIKAIVKLLAGGK